MRTQRALWWWWLLFCWTLPWEIDFGQRQCHVSSPLLCLIVVYLKSVPTGNFFLPGYLGISLCLSCWAKGIKQFWLCCCYALSRQLKRGVAMAQRIYFSCLHAHWGALLVSLLKCVRETSIDPNLLWWAPCKHTTRKGTCPEDLWFCRGKPGRSWSLLR